MRTIKVGTSKSTRGGLMARSLDAVSGNEIQEEAPSAYDLLITSLSRCVNKKPKYEVQTVVPDKQVVNKPEAQNDPTVYEDHPVDEFKDMEGIFLHGKVASKCEEDTDYDFKDLEGSLSQEHVHGSSNQHDNQGEGDQEASEDQSDDESHPSTDPFSVHIDEVLTEAEVETLMINMANPLQYSQLLDKSIGCTSIAVCLPTRNTAMHFQDHSFVESRVKQRLVLQWKKVNSQNVSDTRSFTDLQQHLFSILNSYKDLLFTRRTFENGEDIRKIYLLHALNHVLKTRSKIRKNNACLHRAASEGKQIDEPHDQGLTRPKVLILLPFRDAAMRTIDTMINLLLPKGEGQVNNKHRFYEEFKDDTSIPTKTKKPASFQALFTGNIDDCFRLGVSISNKIIKLYAPFYQSDILIASPLGLRMIIGAEGEKRQDYDFLSSLEMVIVDQADVFLMQNWEHLMHVFHHLHLQPKEAHEVDFSRVRLWCLNGWNKYYCQTAIFSAFPTPEINALFNKHCFNYAGKVKVHEIGYRGSISQVVPQIPQVFHRVEAQQPLDVSDAMFNYFVDKVLPSHTGILMAQTFIFVPSYFDFIRLRNYMKKEELNFVHLCEYSKAAEITRTRAFFMQGRKHFFLYTERLHFFKRLRIRGIKHIIFYSLPQYPEFYSDFVNLIESLDHSNPTCTVMYSKYDILSLSRIVGSARAQRMISGQDSVHMLVTGS